MGLRALNALIFYVAVGVVLNQTGVGVDPHSPGDDRTEPWHSYLLPFPFKVLKRAIKVLIALTTLIDPLGYR
jgi:hypothetical protein